MVSSQPAFTRFGQAYLWTVIGAGVVVVLGSIYQLYHQAIGNQWFILAALTLISGSATVRLPSTLASISISETFVFTGVLLYGPAAGTVIVALDGLVGSYWIAKRHDELHRPLFNMAAPALSAWCSAHLFFTVAGISPLTEQASPVTAILPALVLFALTYFGLNSWLIAFVIGLQQRVDPIKVWKSSFGWLSLNYFGGASVAFLLVGYNRTISLGYIGAIIPLLLVLYFTFKAATGRVEDADRHVEQLNRLYLSTIETLAMAIDAKDQVTHGHIRRVQHQATTLARHVGVHDDKLLKAIEAAALLHDMGKLAVPEYILNKPGKLTDAEFEKMKLHASIGADILSAIEFPYPVVPIVRHHHENWDGTGYPAGIKGTDIPIGARILSVVDCFDALTSDRPYRPKLSDAEALDILRDRRGRMYDPLIVDAFVSMHAFTPVRPETFGSTTQLITRIAHSSRPAVEQRSASLDEITASSDEMLAVYQLAGALAGQRSVNEAMDVVAKYLRRLIPSSLCVLYLYDAASDELEAKYAVGEGADLVRGLKITLGQRLSGWVAANRQTIANSDALLDLGDTARSTAVRLKSCISTPLLADDVLVGTLSLYSTAVDGFDDDHRRVIEAVAPQVANTLSHALTNAGPHGSSAHLPRFEQFENLISTLCAEERNCHTHAFLLISASYPFNLSAGQRDVDDLLSDVVRHAREAIRSDDILFCTGGNSVIAYLRSTNAETAEHIASRLREDLGKRWSHPLTHPGRNPHFCVTVVSGPRDGNSLSELLYVAQRGISRIAAIGGPQVH
jgi:putative nucleotidyltransferase with HDIG domain